MYRFANNKPILKDTRSYCPKCGEEIKGYDNIPLLSFLILRGKCRHCKQPISPRYFIVELFGGLSFLLFYFLYLYIYPNCELGFELNAYNIISAATIAFAMLTLLICAYVDSKTTTVPLSMMITLFVLALIRYLSYVFIYHDAGIKYLLGFGIPLVLLLLIYLISTLIFKTEPMGLADIIIFACLGLLLDGWALFFIVLISSLACSIKELIRIKKTKERRQIPFVPYIFAGAFAASCAMPAIIKGLSILLGGF